MSSFTHLDAEGRVKMVDVTEKEATIRSAVAAGTVQLSPRVMRMIQNNKVAKGNVLETARIAGVMAAKRTADLIPMCHPLNPTHIQVDFFLNATEGSIQITSNVRLRGPTGVEMEALTAVAVAALTIYDMCKSHDKSIVIASIELMEKSGGKSGTYHKRSSTASPES